MIHTLLIVFVVVALLVACLSLSPAYRPWSVTASVVLLCVVLLLMLTTGVRAFGGGS